MQDICIITDIGTIYGFGHITRMKFIANKLKEYYNFTFSSINNNSGIFKDNTINTCKYNEIAILNPYLIIVDSREVDSKYIKELKKISNVIIIDSVGNERAFADIVIEMLPNIDNSKEVNIKPFIATILNSNVKPKYDADAPILLYLGFNNELKNKAIEIISKIEDKNFVLIDTEKESEYTEQIDSDKIINYVSDYYRIPASDIIGKKKTKDIVEARMVAIYLVCEMLNLPLVSIGQIFGGRDHTTIIYSRDKIAGQIAANKGVSKAVEDIRSAIKCG